MYLSRVRVATGNLNARQAGQLMAGDAYGNHQLLWKLFPHENQRPFLFRQELEIDALAPDARPRGLPLFYLLSTVEPIDVPGLLHCEIKPFCPALDAGMQLGFRLRANPVVARKVEGQKNARHHDVLMDAKARARAEKTVDRDELARRMDRAAIEWLDRRSERAGFRLLAEPQLSAYRQHTLRRRGREIRFSSIDYQGVVEVSDPARFHETLARGLGRSKSFGCGLMLIRRVD
ncbi:MAG TPA: type I-E CRISPR-associated protein Cas6/Cse3/CasE [Halothiobacillus sp.]|nr:type I-E CRISPR-associated protein Cas6/Cse3/CasE [Halothiobacillus sp.]